MGSIFICYCLNLSAHFEIFREIINETDLEDFVKYHQQTIKVTKKLTKILQPVILLEFFFVALMLCMSGAIVILSNDYEKVITSFLLTVAVLNDVSIYAYGGQKVLDSASLVTEQLYKMDKNYIIVMMITQKELKFDAGLFHASMKTLSNTLSRTFSLITLIKSIVN